MCHTSPSHSVSSFSTLDFNEGVGLWDSYLEAKDLGQVLSVWERMVMRIHQLAGCLLSSNIHMSGHMFMHEDEPHARIDFRDADRCIYTSIGLNTRDMKTLAYRASYSGGHTATLEHVEAWIAQLPPRETERT